MPVEPGAFGRGMAISRAGVVGGFGGTARIGECEQIQRAGMVTTGASAILAMFTPSDPAVLPPIARRRSWRGKSRSTAVGFMRSFNGVKVRGLSRPGKKPPPRRSPACRWQRTSCGRRGMPARRCSPSRNVGSVLFGRRMLLERHHPLDPLLPKSFRGTDLLI